MQMVLNTPGLMIKVQAGSFKVFQGKEHRLVSPKRVTSIAVTEDCLLSSAAIELAVEYGIPIYFFDRIGDATACLRSPYFESIATLRRQQVYFDDSPEAVEWLLDLFREKTVSQVKHLKYLSKRRTGFKKQLSEKVEVLESQITNLSAIKTEQRFSIISKELMSWEAGQSYKYWRAVSEVLPADWQFSKRSRRPAQDAFNAAINYLYGMLYTVVEQAIFAAGLDPHLGILHSDQYDAPTLAFDLIEPWRPLVDQLLCEQILSNLIFQKAFDQRHDGWYLNRFGKGVIIPAFNAWLGKKVRYQGKERKRQLHIYQAAADLAKRIRTYKIPKK